MPTATLSSAASPIWATAWSPLPTAPSPRIRSTSLTVTYGTVTEDPVNFSVADTLNTIVPKLVPLMLTLLLYYMFAKHSWTPTKGILLLFVLGILGAGPLGLWPSIW